ncbi:MAG TPA: hypothetical protein VGY58_22275 [Gemmataceae bacterium]|nr:hypothetical protein [Gemmataceae bacterium]
MNSIKALHLTGAALLVSRDTKVLQAAPAGELGPSAATWEAMARGQRIDEMKPPRRIDRVYTA